MSEPFSIIAAGIGVVDVGLRLTREIFHLISSFQNATAELRRLNCKIEELRKIFIEILSLLKSYRQPGPLLETNQTSLDALKQGIGDCNEELVKLQLLLGHPIYPSETSFNKFGKRVKTIFHERQLGEASTRLERRVGSLTLLLAAIGRYNTPNL